MKLSVVLTALIYNEFLWKMTVACINNLRFHTAPYELEIILVHNNAKLCPKIKNELTDKDIYLPQETNIMLGKAVNLGVSKATGDYICILAPDVMVHQDWFHFAKQPLDEGKLDFVIPWMWRINLDQYLEKIKNGDYFNPTGFTDGGLNCCLFKRETYDKVGPMDENIMMFSDRDYLWRIAEKKLKTGNYLKSHVTHLGSMTWSLVKTDSPEMEEIFGWKMSDVCERDRIYFLKKWGKPL